MLKPLAASFAFLVLTAAPREGGAQTSTYCRAADAGSAYLLAKVRSWATATTGPYVKNRQVVELPQVPAEEVQAVTDEEICQQAAAAYDRERVRRHQTPPAQRQVHVVRVGSFYVVADPTEKAGEWTVAMVFNATWELVSTFGS